jgi:hypothetical protein
MQMLIYIRVLDPSGPTYTWRGTAGRDIKEYMNI